MRDPVVLKEHVDDVQPDSYAVQHISHLIHNYFSGDFRYDTQFLYEYTDGCSAQYKLRHCMGSPILVCQKEFWIQNQGNYFKTSYDKGEQDAAGAQF